jgi:cytoskeletal protein CcmA (bactofilin family)
MLSRNTDNAAGDAHGGGSQPETEASAAASSAEPPVTTHIQAMPPDQTIIGRDDRVEGTLRAHRTIRVLGTVNGSLEAPSVVVEEGATVNADITADDAVIGGDYHGNVVLRQRLEVAATGRVTGRIETLKFVLHEGGVVDGEIHMTRSSDENIIRVTPSMRSVGSMFRSAGASNAATAGTANGVESAG